MCKKLAIIKKANLEIKDRDILNFWVFVSYEEYGSQGIGGLALDKWDDDLKRRVGTAYGCEMIRRLLKLMDVNDFSEMGGKHIWVHGEGSGSAFKPTGISRLNCDNKSKEGATLMFADVLQEMEGRS